MLKRYLPLVLLSSMVSTTAQADIHLGVRAGTMLIGFDDVTVSEDPMSVAASVGYEFDFIRGLSVEAEASRTVTAGTVVGIDLEVESQGLYIAYETAGNIYLRGRVGYMDASLVAGDLSEAEGGETYGLAIGWRLPGFSVELDYTAIDDDVSFVNVGFRF